MHAIRLHEFGPAENLRYEELPDPTAGSGQALIGVEVSGAHFIDTVIRRGTEMGSHAQAELPIIPGREVAGVVEAVGDEAAASWIGKRVVAHLGAGGGGYAERAVAPVNALHEVPAQLSSEAAVAMIGTGRTALAILDFAAIEESDVVLVLAAAGGLGPLLMQGARNAGAIVVGTAGGAGKSKRLVELGATVGVDHSSPAWTDEVREALDERAPSISLDSVGGEVGQAAMELLGAGGKLILFGWSSGEPTQITTEDLYKRSLTAGFAIGPRLANIPGGMRGLETRALEAAADGSLAPVLDSFGLAEAAAAHAAIEARSTVGKVVLIPASRSSD